MINTSRLITGIVMILIAILIMFFSSFSYDVLILVLFLIIIGTYIFFNKKEDKIEQLKEESK